MRAASSIGWGWLLALEFAIAVLSDVLGRVISLVDGLISERFANETSLRIMEHAATLDLEDFEDNELRIASRGHDGTASGRVGLIGQLFGQAQDVRRSLADDVIRRLPKGYGC